jgi:hypothetical protein
VKITKNDKARVPWGELGKAPSKYLERGTIPKRFRMQDPSKMNKDTVFNLWFHWSERAKSNQPILVFIKAQEQDLGICARYEPFSREMPHIRGKRILYVEVGTNDEASSDESERPSSSKRPCLSKQAAVPDAKSPAANSSCRRNFLSLLSIETPYRALLGGVFTLPAVVSPFFLHP